MNFGVMVRHITTSIVFFLGTVLFLGGLFPKIVQSISTPFYSINNHITSPYAVTFQDLEKLGIYADSPAYFHPRLSTTLDQPYNIKASSSILQPLIPDESSKEVIQERLKTLQLDQKRYKQLLVQAPDCITISSSGLDPHITISNGFFQIARIAKVRGRDIKEMEEMLFDMVQKTSSYEWALFPRVVNILQLNKEIDARFPIEKD